MKLNEQNTKYKSVMLIDDCEIETTINEIIIKQAGFAENVFKYSGGTSSLEFFKNITLLKDLSKDLLPSILFLDINMPVLDGFQFLDEFDKLSNMLIKEIKIIILSSSANLIDINKAAKYSRVVKFMQKPLTKKHLYDFN